MNDKQLAALFMTHLLPAIQATEGLSTTKLARNFQQRQQGASTTPYVYFSKISDHRHGHPKRSDVFNETTGVFDHQEIQVYESTYQFNAWIPQDPANINQLTESDTLNVVSGIIQTDAILAAFNAAGVGILRVTDVRNPYIVDDRDQFEAIPSFDIVLTHQRNTAVAQVAVVTSHEFNVYEVK